MVTPKVNCSQSTKTWKCDDRQCYKKNCNIVIFFWTVFLNYTFELSFYIVYTCNIILYIFVIFYKTLILCKHLFYSTFYYYSKHLFYYWIFIVYYAIIILLYPIIIFTILLFYHKHIIIIYSYIIHKTILFHNYFTF